MTYLKGVIEKIEKAESKNKLHLSISEIIGLYLCRCCIGRKLRAKYTLYEKSANALNMILDVGYITSKIEEIERLKLVLLSEEQLAMFSFLPKYMCSLSGKTNSITKLKNMMKSKEALTNNLFSFTNKMKVNKDMTDFDQKLNNIFLEKYNIIGSE
jgi:hypothetical protein